MRWLGSVLGPQPPKIAGFRAEQAPRHSSEDFEIQAAMEASRLDAAFAASLSSAGQTCSGQEEDRQLQEALQLSVQAARRSHKPAASSWTHVLDNSPEDERLAHALQQAEIRNAGHAIRPASSERAAGSSASTRGHVYLPASQPFHALPGRDAGGAGTAPSAPCAPAPHGWDPFTFDSATPAQHMPAGGQQPTSTWSQQPAPQGRWQQPATPPSWQQPQQSPPAVRATLPDARPFTADDEALARALQASQNDHPRHQPSNPAATAAPHRTAPHTADDEAFARALQASLNSHSQGNAHPFQPNAASLPDRSSPLPSQPQQRVPQQPGSQNGCAGCGRTLPGFWSLGQTIEAAGKRYHAGCFVCGGCNSPLGTGVFVHGQDERLYHRPCHRARFHPRCAVCTQFLPEQNGVISWVTWALQDKCCPSHSSDGTHRCCGCGRLCPRSEAWAEVQPGRHLCLACLDSVVVDTQDAQPLYTKVLAFFAKLGMPLPERPPLLLVDSESLGNAREKEGDCSRVQPPGSSPAPTSGPVLHTRGLCLWQEHRTVRTVMRRGQGGGSFWSTMPQVVQLPESRSEITAIMVLCGLPWLLTGSIIAHEAMHAWLRLSGYPRLPPLVEEGMCQLMAMLWLEQQPAEPEGTWAERLLSLCAHSIRTDKSPVYGDGFRAALDAFQEMGLPALVGHLKQHASFPMLTRCS